MCQKCFQKQLSTEERWIEYFKTITPDGYDISLHDLLTKLDGPIMLSKKKWKKLMEGGTKVLSIV
jgi:hypothetical protein